MAVVALRVCIELLLSLSPGRPSLSKQRQDNNPVRKGDIVYQPTEGLREDAGRATSGQTGNGDVYSIPFKDSDAQQQRRATSTGEGEGAGVAQSNSGSGSGARGRLGSVYEGFGGSGLARSADA